MEKYKNLDSKELFALLMEAIDKLDKREITSKEANKISKEAGKRIRQLNKKLIEAIKLAKQTEKDFD